MSSPERIINLDDLEYREWKNGARFAGRMGEISRRIGASKLGYNLTVVPAGKRAFPKHNHYVLEEMFLVLEGEGEILVGDEVFPLRAGDVVCCPAGGPETAHQIINTMDEGELKYLAVSNESDTDICQYPDSDKKLVNHFWKDGEGELQTLRMILRKGEGEVDYWEDED